MNIVIALPRDMPKPEDIKLDRLCTAGNFGKQEVELAAGQLVAFMQYHKEGWKVFNFDELLAFYRMHSWDTRWMLFGLMGPWFDDGASVILNATCVVHFGDGLMVTQEFLRKLQKEKI